MIDKVDPFQNEGLRQLVETIAGKLYYVGFDSDGRERDERLINGVFEAFVESGLEGAEAYCSEYTEDDAVEAGDQLNADIRAELAKYEDEIAELMAADPLLAALVAYDLEQAVIDEIAEKVIAADTSKPLDIIASSVDILCAYVPGLPAGLSVEDLNVDAIGGLPLYLGFVPNDAYAAFFAFANVSKQDWLSYIEQEHHIALDRPASGPEQYAGHVQDFVRLAEAWNATDWETDASRPALVSLQDLERICDNSYHFANPTLFVKLPLRRFIETVDLNQPLELQPGRHGAIGEWGLHQFIHGAGYVEAVIKQPIVIQPHSGRWLASENPNGFLIGMRKVYDPVEQHLAPVLVSNKRAAVLAPAVDDGLSPGP